jgi:nitrite reductase/ring-hydroxylating ferredoxin subunit
MIQPCPAVSFNNPKRAAEGWYWAFAARDLRRGQARPLTLLGRDLVVYRTPEGRLRAAGAYCPHMGAHLAEGKVDGDGIRCMFHGWRYGGDGACTHTPGAGALAGVPALETFPVSEQYGLVWIWMGGPAPGPLPTLPELDGAETVHLLGKPFRKACHPNVMLINAIDEHHFNTVHPMVRSLAGGLRFAVREVSPSVIAFENSTPVQPGGLLNRLLGRLYRGPLTYAMTYWNGATGTVTLGPDFLRFHIVFALRPDARGRAEGRPVFVARRPRTLAGRLAAFAILRATRLVSGYFAGGDTEIFRSIRFDFRTPTAADGAILRFIRHYEKQPTLAYGRDGEGREP